VDVKRVLSSASWDWGNILREMIRRLPSIVRKGTKPGLECLSFPVGMADLSDLVFTRGKYFTLSSWYPRATS